MRLRWLRRARIDLQDIRAHIAGDNPVAAITIGARIEDRANQLLLNPWLGPESNIPSVRRLLVSNLPYHIYYRVQPQAQRIEILHVRDARRLPPRPDDVTL